MSREQRIKDRTAKVKAYFAKKYLISPTNPIETSNTIINKFEEKLSSLDVDDKHKELYRESFNESIDDELKRLTTDDFEPLALIGKGN